MTDKYYIHAVYMSTDPKHQPTVLSYRDGCTFKSLLDASNYVSNTLNAEGHNPFFKIEFKKHPVNNSDLCPALED